jgi:hypothetical protein
MNFSTEQVAKVASFVNDFGDFFAQDRNDDAMHRCFAVIRHELVEETVPLGHPELRNQLDWIDRILDRIEARRKSTGQHIATNLRSMMFPETRAAFQLN